jgi:hypothetical protein
VVGTIERFRRQVGLPTLSHMVGKEKSREQSRIDVMQVRRRCRNSDKCWKSGARIPSERFIPVALGPATQRRLLHIASERAENTTTRRTDAQICNASALRHEKCILRRML